MRFSQKALLDSHIAARHSTGEVNKFKCPCEGCKYEDMRKGNVVIHFVRIHLKDLVSQLMTTSQEEGCVAHCSVCNTSFKNKTGFFYHASNCVKVGANHTMFGAWNQIHTGKVAAS